MAAGTDTVTVVIPLFNKAREVERAVHSVLDQTYVPRMLLVVDDGSTDGGGDVVEALNAPRLRVFRQDNAGAAAARNRGVREADTELVAFLDADDVWRPRFLETVMDLHRRFPTAGAWATAYDETIGPGREETKPVPFAGTPGVEGGLIEDFFYSIGTLASPLCSDNILIRKSVLQEVGGFPEGEPLAEDLDTWARIALRYRVAFSGSVQATYHTDASNRAMATRRFSGAETCLMRTLRKALSGPIPAHTTRQSLERFLAQHLVVVAKDCIDSGRGVQARAALDEARALGALEENFLRLRLKSYLGIGIVRVLNIFKRWERTVRRKVKGRS